MQIGEDSALSKGSGILVAQNLECCKEKSEIRIFKQSGLFFTQSVLFSNTAGLLARGQGLPMEGSVCGDESVAPGTSRLG